MLYSISGKLIIKKQNFVVVEANGIGFKLFVSSKTARQLPKIGSHSALFCYTNFKQDGVELYGFASERELEIFELLISANGIGPKAGLKIFEAIKIDNLLAAIKQGRSDLLTKVAGIGDKKAQRLVLELRDKIKHYKSEEEVALMETDVDIEKALKNLGYRQNEIKEAIKNLPSKVKKTEERLRAALKFLSK